MQGPAFDADVRRAEGAIFQWIQRLLAQGAPPPRGPLAPRGAPPQATARTGAAQPLHSASHRPEWGCAGALCRPVVCGEQSMRVLLLCSAAEPAGLHPVRAASVTALSCSCACPAALLSSSAHAAAHTGTTASSAELSLDLPCSAAEPAVVQPRPGHCVCGPVLLAAAGSLANLLPGTSRLLRSAHAWHSACAEAWHLERASAASSCRWLVCSSPQPAHPCEEQGCM